MNDPSGPILPPWHRFRLGIRRSVPFAAGVLAALLGLLLYNQLLPAPVQMTKHDLDEAVAQAMASATAAPANSSVVYQLIQPSLVLIQSEAPGADGEIEGHLGSGVVVSEQGDILTSLHVVDNATEIKLTFADGTHSLGEVLMAQPENDIAVLRATEPPALIVPAVLGNPNAMNVGDEIYPVGNPFGLYSSISAGVISGFDRYFEIPEQDVRLEGLIQIDAAVNPGNSGGPLLNREGHVIGIVVGILNPTDEDFFVGIGFAVPIDIAAGAAGSLPY